MTGRIHSVQSLGTVDGPGVRYVLFMQGCPLRCACCHNPDTWDTNGGQEVESADVFRKLLRYRTYFGKTGGVTVSGGEPLLQAPFVRDLFMRCRTAGIHTCLDTSGCMLTEDVKALLALTDRVLLDIKYTTEAGYRQYVGGTLAAPLAFLAYVAEQGIKTTLRQVVIPGLTDDRENIAQLGEIARRHACVDKIELLPFRKLCTVKYESMGIPFPLAETPEADPRAVKQLESYL